MPKLSGSSSFVSHRCFVRRYPVNRLVLASIGFLASLSAVVSLAQQPKLPQAAAQQRKLPQTSEPANIIRLRQEWFYQQRAYPHQHIPPGARLKALEQLRKMEAVQRSGSQRLKEQTTNTLSTTSTTSSPTQAATLSSTSWTLIGPQPTNAGGPLNVVSGRVTALAVDPTNPNVVYLGAAEGGVWKTTDGGQAWTPLTDNQPSLSVGSIALDPQNPQTIYVGTGEEDFGYYDYGGAGVLKSTDGGSTWTQLAGPFVGPFASRSPECGGAYIGSIAVDPANSQILLAGADFSCNTGSGVYRSTNGGTSWSLVLGTLQSPFLITGLVFDPTNGNNVYAAVGLSPSNSQNGIWKSTNAGLSWTLDNGSGTTAFPGSSAARISLAIAPYSPTTLYAGAASISSNSASLLGVYKTTNGGASWTQLTTAPNYCSPTAGYGQCYFDNVVAVAPNNANIVFLGGSIAPSSTGYAGTLYLSLDGGSSWTDITTDSNGNAIHPDMHAIAFSSDGSKMYVGNDGGAWSVSLSTTGAGTWNNLNQPLALTQFYPGLSMDPTNPNLALAGSQDNGVQGDVGNLEWNWVICGDGAETAIDPADSGIAYAGCGYFPGPNNQYFLFKFTPGSGWAPADNGIDGADRGAFIPPLTMDPSNPNTLYFGTDHVYETIDGGNSWTSISSDLTYGTQGILSTISAIAVAPSNSNTVYVGTNDGRLWLLCCSYITNGTPKRSVTAIAVDPANSTTAYATFSGYSGFNGDTLGHVFETTNSGTTWTDISANLPNIPVNDIVVDPDIPNTLYIATDVGVFETSDGGTTWAPVGTGLPSVVIMSLKLHHATRILRAASYGRSAWDLQLPAPVGPTAVLSTLMLDFAPQQVGTTSSAQTVTLTNNSSTSLSISGISASTNFAESNTCGSSLAAGTNCTISVTFTPAALGVQTGTVTITDNAASGRQQTVTLHGSGYSGAVSLSPTSLTFGNQLVSTTSAAQTVTLTNTSTAPLIINEIDASADFYVPSFDCPLSTTGPLAAGASCHINIAFRPEAMGMLVEQITIRDSAGNSPQAIPVTGTGVLPIISFSHQSLNFTQQVGTTSLPQTVTLTNTGTADLVITQISLNTSVNPNPFTESDNCPRSPSAIPPQGSCTINITFAPSTWGQFNATITITDTLGGTAYLYVNGFGYSGIAALSPTMLIFPITNVGQTSAAQTVTLTDSGTTPLYVASISVTSSFNETDNCPRSPSALNASGSCTISVTFSPNSRGGVAGTLSIFNSGQSYPSQVSLQGSGVAPAVSLNPTNLSFAQQGVKTTSASQSVSVTNSGNANLTISGLSITGTNASDFAIAASGTTCSAGSTVTPGTNCSIAVTFTPTALGIRNAAMSIADNAQGSPQIVSLGGLGVDFAMAVTPGTASSESVTPGGAASYSLALTPEGGFNQAIFLACTGAPSGATCTVSPSTVALDGTNAQAVKVTVTTAAPTLVPPGPKDGPPTSPGFAINYWWIALLLLASFALALKRPRRAFLLASVFLLFAITLSCGGGGGVATPSPGTPAGTYTLTVTGTSGSLTHQTALKLAVQ